MVPELMAYHDQTTIIKCSREFDGRAWAQVRTYVCDVQGRPPTIRMSKGAQCGGGPRDQSRRKGLAYKRP